MSANDYTFVPNLVNEFAIPENGIISRVLHKDERLNITLFGFSAGQELSTHSAPTPALIQVLEGEADIDLGSDTVQVKPGSFIRMAPLLSHAVRAKTPFRMLLVQVKEAARQK
ncbi:MAG TPA: cupin domain-containing protein [Terriglobales bacterium]|nr:cupin domain-containing protein [Terriglobales bacterium]